MTLNVRSREKLETIAKAAENAGADVEVVEGLQYEEMDRFEFTIKGEARP